MPERCAPKGFSLSAREDCTSRKYQFSSKSLVAGRRAEQSELAFPVCFVGIVRIVVFGLFLFLRRQEEILNDISKITVERNALVSRW